METVIAIKNLTKDYEKGFWKKRKIRALDDLTLDVAPGQIFGFLGGNGAGKTTTIKLLMRLIFPTSGTAQIFGQDISDVSMHSKVGYCPESPYFYDYLTPAELMDYFGQLFGIDQTTRKSRGEELLNRVGLETKDWNRQLRKFSKGMLQRVGIAQSLISDPELILLDEPMSGLDPVGRREIRELIGELRDKGKTVFMSSHILSDIEALCDNVAILRSGRLVEQGNLHELLTTSGTSQLFEVHFKGVSADQIRSAAEQIPNSAVVTKPNGGMIEVRSDEDVREAINVITSGDGNLVSVQPVRQSLEDFFKEPEESADEV